MGDALHCHSDARRSVFGEQNVKALPDQATAEDVAVHFIVFNDENARHISSISKLAIILLQSAGPLRQVQEPAAC
jgi:hypothetical protein